MKRLRVIALCLFVVSLDRSVGAQVLDLYDEAENAFAKKDYATHAGVAERILRHSRHPSILFRLAQSYAATGRRDEAIAVLQELAKKGLAYDLAVPEPLRSLQSDARLADLERRFAANRKTVDRSSTAFVLGDRELIPEGITVDPRSGDFFVGSLAKSKVVTRKHSGAESDFARVDRDGLRPVLGIKVDANARELWVCSASEKDGQAGVFVFDLGSGALRRKFVRHSSKTTSGASGPHLFNDIALDGRGGAYVTDSKAGKVYAIRPGSDRIEELAGDFVYPNGIVLDGDRLFVADLGGLTRIDLPAKARRKVDDRGVTFLEGIDGLSLYEGTLIAVQDGGNADERIVRFHLDASKSAVERVEVLQSVRGDFVSPTTGTVYGDHYYYIANSFVRNLRPDMTVSEPETLKPPLILKVPLRQDAPRSTVSVAGHECLVLLTGGAKADDTLPMIIGLHYSRGTPEIMASDFDAIDFPARVVLPRGRHPRPEGSSWFPSEYGRMSVADQTKITLEVTDEISAFVAEAVERFATRGKPVMIGVSYGGDLSYLIAIRHPEQVAAAFPVAARFPVEWIPSSSTCDADCPPVHVMQGGKDAIISIESSRAAAKRLVERGYRVELHEFKEDGHELSAAMKAGFTEMVKRLFAAEQTRGATRLR